MANKYKEFSFARSIYDEQIKFLLSFYQYGVKSGDQTSNQTTASINFLWM